MWVSYNEAITGSYLKFSRKQQTVKQQSCLPSEIIFFYFEMFSCSPLVAGTPRSTRILIDDIFQVTFI